MTRSLDRFEPNVQRATDLANLAAALEESTSEALDLCPILSAAIVAGVSSLDNYVHELLPELMTEIAKGNRAPTKRFDAFQVPLSITLVALDGELPEQWVADALHRQYGHRALQHAEQISDAIKLVWDGNLWRAVGDQLGQPSKEVRRHLGLIVKRRNLIVHAADLHPVERHRQNSIRHSDVLYALQAIRDITQAIDVVVA